MTYKDVDEDMTEGTVEKEPKKAPDTTAADLFPTPQGHSGREGGVYVGVLPGRRAPSLYMAKDGQFIEVISIKNPETAKKMASAINLAHSVGVEAGRADSEE